jgi:antitoxin (DNA-binding transcriptional repressor) of toxin-antitoxin stability system
LRCTLPIIVNYLQKKYPFYFLKKGLLRKSCLLYCQLTWVLSLRKLGAIFDYFLDRIDKTIFIENHPMITISLKEAQAQLPDLIHNLKLGEELLITDNDRLLAKLVGQSSTPSQRPVPAVNTSPTRAVPVIDGFTFADARRSVDILIKSTNPSSLP